MPDHTWNSDKALVVQLNQNKSGAFKLIFDQYWDYIYAICYKGSGDREVARELTQEIFKSLWERRRKIKANGSLRHYLIKAAKHQLSTYYRNQKVEKKYFDKISHLQSSSQNFTEETISYEELERQVKASIDQLPQSSKKVFLLSFYKKQSHKEIANKLNISVKTVEYHMAKSRSFLHKCLLAKGFHYSI
ncbi:MAG: RNA polymerase sigma-70 factor [Bacteroidota bacterium]